MVQSTMKKQKQNNSNNNGMSDDLFAGFGDTTDFELDFNLDDFQLTDGTTEAATTGANMTRIMPPRLNIKNVSQMVAFKHAKELARNLELRDGCRDFCWVSGNFIFGDLIEALITERNVWPKRIYICSLGMSQENIDSLHNILKYTDVESLTLVLSAYFYSHEKDLLVPYIYQQLDVGNKTQIVFGNYHCKIICIETTFGHHLVMHGSANLRSSNSIEQIMIEEDKEFYDFNTGIMDELAKVYGTINHKKAYVGSEESWQAVLACGREIKKASSKTLRGRRDVQTNSHRQDG